MSKQTAEVLREARSYIERGWCTGVEARNRRGRETGPGDRHAASWCAVGAFYAISADYISLHRAGKAILRAVEAEDLAIWNDAPERTQAEVLAAFDRAIAAEEAGE